MDGQTTEQNACELCGRAGLELTRHHLIPRKQHRRPRCRRTYSRDERQTRIAMLCRPCHSTVHAHLTEQQLEQTYNTLGLLAEHPEISRFVQWVRKQPAHRRVAVRRPRGSRR